MTSWLARQTPRRRGVIAAVAGAASGLALPPLHAIPLLLVAVPLLLALLDVQATWRAAAATGFWFGFGLNLVGLYWITEAILIEADTFWWLVPLAVPALSAVLAAFIAAACCVAWLARPGWRRVATLSGAWVLADIVRQFVVTGFPWNPLGSVWGIPGALGDVFLQPASLVGVHGLTLATLLLAGCLGRGRSGQIAAAAGLALWAGFGVLRLAAPMADPAQRVALVLVQGDVPEGEPRDRARVNAIFDRNLALTRSGLARARAAYPEAVPVVVWPETASPFLLETDRNAGAAIAQAAPGALVLAGSVRFDSAGRPRNSLVALAAGVPVAIYDKAHLVPFGEYEPDWLPLQITPGGGFAPGPGPRTLDLPGVPPAGALICYEAIFPAAVVEPGRRPGWLVNVTNDAWFGDSTGPRQHLAAARMRAVEEGLPLARAANTGISAVFDRRGHELARLGLLREGTVVALLPPTGPPTLASRLGLWPPLLLAAVALAIGLRGRPAHRSQSQKS